MADLTIGGRTYQVEIRAGLVVVDGREIPVTPRLEPGYVMVTAGGVPYRVELPPESERTSGMEIKVDYRPFTIEYGAELSAATRPAAPRGHAPSSPRPGAKGGISAQMTGRVISVKVKPGDAVRQGDVLLLLEAMKMENEVRAPADGTVVEVMVADGARVSEGDTLVVLG